MDRQITVERLAVQGDPGYEAPDSTYGTAKPVWVPLTYLPGSPAVAEKFWAEVQDALPSRSESVRQGLTVARNQTRIRLRWRRDIDSAMRVRLHGDGDDEILQIVGGPAEIEGRKGRIEIVCERYSTDTNG